MRLGRRVLTTFLLCLLSAAAVGAYSLRAARRARQAAVLIERGTMLAALMSYRWDLVKRPGSTDSARDALQAVVNSSDALSAALLTADGSLLAVAVKGQPPAPMAAQLSARERRLLEESAVRAGACGTLEADGRVDVVCPIRTPNANVPPEGAASDGAKLVGFVKLSFKQPSEREDRAALARSLAPMLAVLVLGAGWLLVVVRRATEPLERLSRAMAAFGAGDPVPGLPGTEDDEAGGLVAEFKEMMRSLAARERERNREHEQLVEQLQQARLMEAVGTISQGISHDFKNILSTLKTGVHILQKGSSDNAFVLKYAGKMQTSLERARELVDRLVAFSPRRKVLVGPLDLGTLLARLTPMLREAAGESVRLDVERPDEPVMVVGDAAGLEQMMMNLAYNARDAMPMGGFLKMRLEMAAGTARVTVRDTGVGIAPEVRLRLFEPDFSTKDPGAGMGLGLSLVHNIVVQHRGRVEVESELGEGTAFRVELPLAGALDADETGGALSG